jgi:valyl-tRNA synthetase
MRDGADAHGRVPEALIGLDRAAARDAIVAQLKALGRLVKIEAHQHSIRRCYRCDTIVEPRLSDQWFVRMKPLAEPALRAVRERAIRILPERWEAVYVNWLDGIRDWNISRQLWWGHRIPVWYCDGCGKVTASRVDLNTCPACAGPVRQDDDVLDTWFSSGLWPFSTLGWPDETPDLRAFYPTDVLVTAPEILFFWVARMIMTGFAFMGDAPFHTVYLHGTVRDTNHVKMSKSLGNGIDPLDVVRTFGADALRYTVIAGMGLGADTILDPNDLERSFAPGRNFVTKLWNMGRFLLTNAGAAAVHRLDELDPGALAASDRWILHRLNQAITACNAALGPTRPSAAAWSEQEQYAGLRLNEFTEAARGFVWNDLADWYLEAVKGRLGGDGRDAEVARAVLVHAFDRGLRLLHPIVPFVTEALWSRLPLPEGVHEGFLASAAWPQVRDWPGDATAFDVVQEAVGAIRQLRAEYGIPPGKGIAGVVRPASPRTQGVMTQESATIERLARCQLTVSATAPGGAAAHAVLSEGTEVVLPLAGMIDVEKECARLRGEVESLDKQLTALRARLANANFVARAKPEVVEAERAREQEWTARRGQLHAKVTALCGG